MNQVSVSVGRQAPRVVNLAERFRGCLCQAQACWQAMWAVSLNFVRLCSAQSLHWPHSSLLQITEFPVGPSLCLPTQSELKYDSIFSAACLD